MNNQDLVNSIKQDKKLEIGILGLGKMGMAVVENLLNKKEKPQVVVYNRTEKKTKIASEKGAIPAYSLQELVNKLSPPRLVWLMVSSKAVDNVLFGSTTKSGLTEFLEKGDLVADGGNSYYKESQRRYKQLLQKGIHFLDVGSSGGAEGALKGLCMMVGGDQNAFNIAKSVFSLMAEKEGLTYFGKSGAGHFVKMVHNAIQDAILQAYGEGFEILKKSDFGLDLSQVARTWKHGSNLRSFHLNILLRYLEKDPNLEKQTGFIGGGETGIWTINEAIAREVPIVALYNAIAQRFRSRSKDSVDYKVVQAMRTEWGAP